MTIKTVTTSLAALLAACLAAAPALAQDALLKKVKDRGTLRACSVNYVPWNVKNPITNAWEGINIEIIDEVAKALGVKLEHVDSAWATVIQSVQADKCDIAIAALWTAPARAEQISFTRPVGGDGIGLFVPANATVKHIADVDQPGKTIAVLSGSADERTAKETFKQATVKSVVTDKAGGQLLEVASGRADAAFGGLAGNSQFLKANPAVKVKPVEGFMLNYTPFAFAVPAREYFFRDYVSTVIGNLDASGKLQQIRERWTKVGG